MRFLLVGAGIGQKYIAKKIKQRGHYLIVFAYNSISDVVDIADEFIHLDLFDYSNVLNQAKKKCVDAVVSDQHDIFAPLVAFLAEQLHLPGNTFAVLEAYCNKNCYRENCDKLGIPVPKHMEIKAPEIPKEFVNVPFPWIVKPADSQSSVGVKKVTSVEECVVAIKEALSFSRSKTAIVEEFFEGKELVAEGFIWKGKYFNLGYADRVYFNLKDLFIPAQTIFPSTVNKKVLDKVFESESKMASYISPNFAIVHSEYLYNPNTNDFCVVESALRGGGVYISSHLIPLYTNIDLNDILLDAAEGKTIDMPSILKYRQDKAAAYVCFYLPEGKILSVDGIEKLKNDKAVALAEIDSLKIDSVIHKIEHKGQRLGPIIVKSGNREKLEDEIKRIQGLLSVKMDCASDTLNSINWN